MKKVFISLFFWALFSLPIYSCDKWFTLRKISCILENIVRRVDKNPFDYLDAEIVNIINLFYEEHGLACTSCRDNAEYQSLHLIVYLNRHMKRYKKLIITAL